MPLGDGFMLLDLSLLCGPGGGRKALSSGKIFRHGVHGSLGYSLFSQGASIESKSAKPKVKSTRTDVQTVNPGDKPAGPLWPPF